MPSSSSSQARPSVVGSRPPVIGISTYSDRAVMGDWNTEFDLIHRVYSDGVVEAGAVAVLVPPQPSAAAVLERLDGLVISGGSDVEAGRYGADPHPAAGRPRVRRDESELALIARALELELPVLAICRGAQLLNVALGGTLQQHLPDVVGDDRHQPGNAVFGRTEVRVAAGSRLAAIVGSTVNVHCYHHQAVDVLGAGLTATAHAGDGTTEGIELSSADFVLGVQWHPEQDAADRRLFHGLADAAHRYANTAQGTVEFA